MSLRDRIPILAAALWWGSLSTIGLLVVPLLFAHMATPADAGRIAARLFQAQTWVSFACGLLLLMSARKQGEPARMDWARGCVAFVLSGLLLALLAEFAIAPRILARENLKLWHGIGSAMYLLQWLCAGVALWKVAGQARHHGFRPDAPS